MADVFHEIEYHVKYPVVQFNFSVLKKEKRSEDDTEEEEKTPVIILFGWTGCRDKYLCKYSSIYEENGCITLRCVIPPMITFIRHDKFPKVGKKLLKLIQELSLDDHPIFFHVFSNGGAFLYQHVGLQLQKKKIVLDIRGAIFDSSPGRVRFKSIYKTLLTVLGATRFNVFIAGFISVVLYFVYMMFALTTSIIFLQKPSFDMLMLQIDPFKWPQLLIYSKTDELIKYQDIEKFAMIREKKGVLVKRKCFEKSPHVQHMIVHREDYVNTVVCFVQDCLKFSKKFSWLGRNKIVIRRGARKA